MNDILFIRGNLKMWFQALHAKKRNSWRRRPPVCRWSWSPQLSAPSAAGCNFGTVFGTLFRGRRSSCAPVSFIAAARAIAPAAPAPVADCNPNRFTHSHTQVNYAGIVFSICAALLHEPVWCARVNVWTGSGCPAAGIGWMWMCLCGPVRCSVV